MKLLDEIFLKFKSLLITIEPIKYFLFIGLYLTLTLISWSRYGFNPTSMLNIGKEFADKNAHLMPQGAIVLSGYEGDLGAGYDGQIFYFYSRVINQPGNGWPIGFDESYRAPRIGYPLLGAIFGVCGKYGNIFGMYFFNIFLLLLSFHFMRKMLKPETRYLSLFYLFSPFALGSYIVLVSDSVMISLVIISYYLFLNKKYLLFSLTGGLAILVKEPALFFLFPLGLKTLIEKDWKKSLVVISSLIYPILWHSYLRVQFPSWSPVRLMDFILPLEGITSYIASLGDSFKTITLTTKLARQLSRLPLLFLFITGLAIMVTGNIKKGYEFRLTLLLSFFMIGTASFYHFWSVYENISRMFTITIPALILLMNEDETRSGKVYFLLTSGVLILFVIKLLFITKAQPYTIWQ